MAAIKFLLLVCLAFSAGQVQAASTAEPKEGSLLLYRILEDLVTIVQVIVKAVNDNKTNLDEPVGDLISLCPDDTKPNLQAILDWIKNALEVEDDRVAQIIAILEKAISDLGASDSCTSPEDGNIKTIADTLVSAINAGIVGAIDANKADVDNIIAGLAQLLEDLRALYDTNLPAAVKCLTLGNADSCNCLTDLKNTVVNGIVGLGASLALELTQINDIIIGKVIPQAVDAITPALGDFGTAIQDPINDICSCVAES